MFASFASFDGLWMNGYRLQTNTTAHPELVEGCFSHVDFSVNGSCTKQPGIKAKMRAVS
jgi:hypothetical protein